MNVRDARSDRLGALPLGEVLRRVIFPMGLLALAICLLTYIAFEQQKQNILHSAQKNLAGIADLKVDEIQRWRSTQIDDAVMLTRHSRLIAVFDNWLRAGTPESAEQRWMQQRLEAIRSGGNYAEVTLIDARGKIRLSAPEIHALANSQDAGKQSALRAMAARQIALSDLHLSSAGKAEIDLLVPLFADEGPASPAIGALYLGIDPAVFLFPLIQSWPTGSESAETLLVRREGSEVLFLNELRYRDKTALVFRLPLDTPELPTAQAAQGKSGFMNGTDYRGHKVAAYLRQIPETGWAIVSKIDEDEIYAPVRQLALWTGGITLLLLGLSFVLFLAQFHRVQLRAHNRQLRLEKKLLHNRFEDLSRFANDIFLLFDLSGQVVEVNEEAVKAYGYTREEFLRMSASSLRAADATPLSADWQTILTQGQAVYETLHRRKDGSTFPIEVSARVLHLEHGSFVQTIVRDISARKQAEQRLHHLAYYDDLTHLPNRTLFVDHLAQAMRTADRRQRLVGIMFMDLDDFKIVNDTLGHEAGNALLCEVADRLKTCFREGDTVSRFGGDEFAVVLSDMSHVDDASRIAQKVLQAFEAPFELDTHRIFVTLCIGITIYPFDDDDSRDLLRNADSAMYHAKSMGRGHFQFYSAELTQRARKRMMLEDGLRYALERGEFMLHYQPQVDLKTGLIVGVEALVRWMQPGHGMVSPADFIPVAEESGLIVPLGEWILRTACAQAKAWQDQGFPVFTMAVNLSSRQFVQGHLVEMVRDALEKTGLSPECLELEITESVLLDQGDTLVLSMLNELKQMRVSLAIDDFGTGYSSLSYLKRFPIDKLKIDRSFVQSVTTDGEDASLVQAIIAMAHSLRLTVIAEGVETEDQHDHLHHHGCDQMQGYFFSRPLPAEQIGDLFSASYSRNAGRKNSQLPLSFK